MDFVNPSLLFGVTAAAVPIVLHLIMRQHPRHLEFPALRFVKRREEANRRRLRLRHWLLLALRVAALCLLALALARPSLRSASSTGSRQGPVSAVLVFDTSPRMLYREQNQSRLEVAQQLATWLLTQLAPDSQVAVLESRDSAAVYQIDLGSARQRIQRLEPTAAPRPWVELLTAAARLAAEGEHASKELYFFSDLTQPAWTASSTAELQAALAKIPTAAVQLVDVGLLEPKNSGLSAVRLSGQVLSRNSPLRIQVDLTRAGADTQAPLEAYLIEETLDASGHRQRQARQQAIETVSLAGDQLRTVELRLGGLEPGIHQGLIRLAGEDALAVDNVRYFSVLVKRPWRILIAAPSPADEFAFFLQEALAPDNFRKNDQARFQIDTVALEELGQQKLADYSAVCLLDPAPLLPEVWRRLHDFTAQGGGLFIALGRRATPLEAFHTREALELLPAPLVQQARRPDGQLHLDPQQYEHPLLARFRPLAGQVPWDGFPVYRYWQLDEPVSGTSLVIPYSDGRPALLERPVGQGRVLTLTTPISDAAESPQAWNLLPTAPEPWPFVMLVNETLLYLVGSADGTLNYQAGQTAIWPLAAADATTSYLLFLPPAELAIDPLAALSQPGEEPLRRHVDPRLRALVETGTERLGNYRLRAGGDEGLDAGFSVNLAADAGDLTPLDRADPVEIRRFLGDRPFRVARTQEQIQRDQGVARLGQELYPWLIVLVAVALAGEHWLANRFYRAT